MTRKNKEDQCAEVYFKIKNVSDIAFVKYSFEMYGISVNNFNDGILALDDESFDMWYDDFMGNFG